MGEQRANTVMRILMIDDHVMFLQGLKSLLNVLAPEFLVETSDRLDRAVTMAASESYQLVLLDWHLGECDGAAAIGRLRSVGCLARIVVLSGETRPSLVHEVIELGAAGFISKQHSSEVMLEAVQTVIKGGVYLPPEALRDFSEPPRAVAAAGELVEIGKRFSELTPRQIEVYQAAILGLPNKLIARKLGIAESTVKTHLSVVYGVMGVQNRTQAAYQACREGFRVA
jgi:DNA-binding NarL/FixJ family response regulator